jgi:hypothetical protein
MLGPGHSESTTVEWDDLDAAVAHAADIHEMALLTSSTDAAGARRYDLVTILDEPVRIVFTPLPDGAGDARPAEIDVQVGLFGDASREEAILATLTDRLDWLMQRD